MLGKVTADEAADWREQRRVVARRTIIEQAWLLADERGLDSWTMRELAEAVGVRAPSLYGHFDGKPAILDALFADGYRAMDQLLEDTDTELPNDLSQRDRLVAILTAWLGFCQESPARYRLMFTSAIPGWRPSDDAYAVSQASYATMARHLQANGITPGVRLDLFTAVTSGIAAQQLANDPHGDRWVRLIGHAVDMFLSQLSALPEERS